MKRIEINVIHDECLGYKVFRGSIKASELYPALWIDFHDKDFNPDGYQRPFNEVRSQDAADYAVRETKAFWPEAILNIRANPENGQRVPVVHYSYQPISPEYPNFGKLIVDYDETKTKDFGGKTKQWERAFAEVDCQHRLGKMENVDKYVTVCIFERLTCLEEALIFRVINQKHTGVSTSLVDEIIFKLGQKDPEYGLLYEPTKFWARKLSDDSNNPFYNKVDTGGTNIAGRTFFVKLRTLGECCRMIIGDSNIKNAITKIELGNVHRQTNYDKAYEFLVNFWKAVKSVWSDEWAEPNDWKNYKLLTTPGLKGLSQVGNKVFEECKARNNYNFEFIKSLILPAKGYVDWTKKTGDFKDASGNAGARIVKDKLRQKILPETTF